MDKRTPRNYSGTQNTAKKLADLLPDAMFNLNKKRALPKEEILYFWQQLMGENMANLTEIVSFDDGVLTVKVKSSTLYSLLSRHEKPRLLAQLKEKFSIRDLKFRVG